MAGIDPAETPIPIRPAVHYHMGGIAVDGEGRSTVRGLWACGEVARTGLHGANRLASNSLVEAIVCARWVAESVNGTGAGPLATTDGIALPTAPDPSVVRPILSPGLGVLRDHEGIAHAIRRLYPLACSGGAASDAAVVALMIALAALDRAESRGGHYRTDYPETPPSGVPSFLSLAAALETAREIAKTKTSLDAKTSLRLVRS
jgi:L-aspartate oxidase